MNFGQALEALKKGDRVARAGWNGKGMWLHLMEQNSAIFTDRETNDLEEMYVMQPFIAMKTVQDTLVPWLASQSDVLAEDWGIVE